MLYALSFLGPRDLCTVGATCRALRLLPFDEWLWEPLTRARFPAVSAHTPSRDVVSWRSEYRFRGDEEVTTTAYMRDMPMGRVGRGVAPSRMRLPRLSLHESRAAVGACGEAAAAGAPLRFGAGVARPAVPVKHGVLAPVEPLAGRQGSAVWTVLK